MHQLIVQHPLSPHAHQLWSPGVFPRALGGSRCGCTQYMNTRDLHGCEPPRAAPVLYSPHTCTNRPAILLTFVWPPHQSILVAHNDRTTYWTGAVVFLQPLPRYLLAPPTHHLSCSQRSMDTFCIAIPSLRTVPVVHSPSSRLPLFACSTHQSSRHYVRYAF